MAGGILKNKYDADQQAIKLSESNKEFREQVLKNTKLNSLLKSNQLNTSNNGNGNNGINKNDSTLDEKLKWNNQNLNDNEILQKQIIENLTETIDEPKTPFQKALDPALNEYYQSDDEEKLDDFSLGEPEFRADELDQLDNINKYTEVIHDDEEYQNKSKDENQDQAEDEYEVEDEEEEVKPKKSFAELRKEHYHNEIVPAVEASIDDDEEDEDEEEKEETKLEKSFAEKRKEFYHQEHAGKK